MKWRKLLYTLLIILPLVLLVALVSYLAFWNWPTHIYSIDPEEVYSIEFLRGTDRIVVRDPEVIDYLANHFSSLTYRRRIVVRSFPPIMGGGNFWFRTKSGKTIVCYPSQFVSDDHVQWEAYPPGVDTDYIHKMMETAPGE